MSQEPQYLSDVLVSQPLAHITMQEGLLSITALALALGTVMARKANGEFTPIDFAGAAPLNKAVAVLAEPAEVSTSTQKRDLIRRIAAVSKDGLVWPAGASTEQITTALAELEALTIVPVNVY